MTISRSIGGRKMLNTLIGLVSSIVALGVVGALFSAPMLILLAIFVGF